MSNENPYEDTFVFDPPVWLLLDKNHMVQGMTTNVQPLGEIKVLPIFTEALFAERFVSENKQAFAWQEHATLRDLESNLDEVAKIKDRPTYVTIDPGKGRGRFYPLELFIQHVKRRIAEES